MKNDHLLLFSIGPVQSFIAQARKTRDLFGGSRLLSELIRWSIDEFAGRGGKVIFPASNESDSLPNRFIAEWKGSSAELQQIGQELEAGIRAYWLEQGRTVFRHSRLEWGVEAETQMANHLEVYWVAVTFSPENYSKAFAQLEQRLGARKNIRAFQQVHHASNDDFGEAGKKCNLDGTYNALVTHREYREFRNCKNIGRQVLHYSHSIDVGEGLSAISFTKRNFLLQHFNSTAGIAFLDTLQQLKQTFPVLQEDIEYLDKVNEQIWGEEKLSDEILKQYSKTLDYELINQFDATTIRRKWKKIKKKAEEKQLRFTKYYAVVLFDGDSMGKWLSGDRQYLREGVELKDFHAKFSSRLGEFAQRAKAILEPENANAKGQYVYAGGDDFMGLVNLNHLLPVMKALRLAFYELVHLPLADAYIQPGREISFSGGICIAGIKEPLRVVLEYARHLEKEAKKRFKAKDKNALAVGFIKGSGELQETYWQQYVSGANTERKLTIDHFAQIYQLLASDRFSGDFIRTLDLEMRSLAVPEPQIAQVEIDRLVYRKYKAKAGEGEREKEAYCNSLSQLLGELFRQAPQEWNNFLSALYMCSFLKDKLNYQYHHAVLPN